MNQVEGEMDIKLPGTHVEATARYTYTPDSKESRDDPGAAGEISEMGIFVGGCDADEDITELLTQDAQDRIADGILERIEGGEEP